MIDAQQEPRCLGLELIKALVWKPQAIMLSYWSTIQDTVSSKDEWKNKQVYITLFSFGMTILEWIPVMVDTVLLIIWLVLVALMMNFHVFE